MNGVDELLRELAPLPKESDAEERIAEQIARRQLRRAMADADRRPRRRRSGWRWGWRWRGRFTVPLAGVLAGALAAMILVIVALLPAHDASAPAPASAAVVLERTARVATGRPASGFPGPHQYLYLKFRERWTVVESPVSNRPSMPTFALQATATEQAWVARDGSGRQRIIIDGAPRFLTKRDRAAWDAAGRPKVIPPSLDGKEPAGGYPAGDQIDTAGLPTQPRPLLRAIVTRFEGGRFDLARTFEKVGTLLQDSGSPALRAALYRMVAQLRGVQLLGRQTDALGRTGIAVGIMERGGLRDELLFDPASSDALQEEQVVARTQARDAPYRDVPVGTVLSYFAYEGRGVVDSIEALPGGGRVPFHGGGR